MLRCIRSHHCGGVTPVRPVVHCQKYTTQTSNRGGRPFYGCLAVVSGGTRGIGNAIARSLLDDGFNVAILGRNQTTCDDVSRQLRASIATNYGDQEAPPNVKGYKCDVRNSQEVEQVIQLICQDTELHGSVTTTDNNSAPVRRGVEVHTLVNCAGVSIDKLLVQLTDADIEDMLATNVKGALYLSRSVVKGMIRKRTGNIINVGSIVGAIVAGNTGQVGYATSKAALLGMTKTMAKELGPKGIRVNMVAPGWVATDMTKHILEKQAHEIVAKTPLQRLATENDVSEVVRFLIRHPFLTGECITVDGGYSL